MAPSYHDKNVFYLSSGLETRERRNAAATAMTLAMTSDRPHVRLLLPLRFTLAALVAASGLTLLAGVAGCGGRAAPPEGSQTDDASAPAATSGQPGAQPGAPSDASPPNLIPPDGGGPTFTNDPPPPVVLDAGPTPGGWDAGVMHPGLCPALPPALGDACTVDGAHCTYGTSVSPMCRDGFRCASGSWVQETSSASCTRFDPSCGVSRPEQLAPCRGSSVACHLDDGTMCLCQGPTPGSWLCVRKTADPDCPPLTPNAGTSCASSAQCTYGFSTEFCPHDAAFAACVRGVWLTEPAPNCHD